MKESEHMKHQIRSQEEALDGAYLLKEQTDRMIVDYEKMKADLAFYMKRSAELQSDLEYNVNERRKAEDESLRAVKDLDDLKMKSRG